jgi:hypothetical protein
MLLLHTQLIRAFQISPTPWFGPIAKHFLPS